MACTTCGSNMVCQCDPTVLEGPAIGKTLIASLAPTVDCIRDLYTSFGARPYQVFLVWTQWSGGERGEGIEEVIREVRVLPTPAISDMKAISTELMNTGKEETGNITVSQISPTYNEDLLLGRENDGTPVPRDQNFYWEVWFPRADSPGVRRRFYPQGAPSYDALKFEWTVNLLKISEDRDRSGAPGV